MSDLLSPLLSMPRKRLALLEALAELGSINQAAAQQGISYKTAWEWIDSLNNLAPQPIVERTTGGKGGGGSVLTDYGRQLTEGLSLLEKARYSLHASLTGTLEEPEQLVSHLRRMTLKTSARNQLLGTITQLEGDEVNCNILLNLGGDDELHVQITQESAQALALSEGTEVIALFKANAVILAEPTLSGLQTSTLSRLRGWVSRIIPGAQHAEIGLSLSGGRNLTAVVDLAALELLQLHEGKSLEAWIAPQHILLATGF